MISYWSTPEMAPFIGDKIIFLNHKYCYFYRVNDGDRLGLSFSRGGRHKITYHVMKMNSPSNILSKCNDTDIVVIMLGNINNFTSRSNVRMHLETGNSSRYLSLTRLSTVLTPSICEALPEFHALTGCDYNPSFFGKAKSIPFNIMAKSKRYQAAFPSLGKKPDVSMFTVIEEFICNVYGHYSVKSVDGVRYAEFLKNYKPTHSRSKFKRKLKNLDASSLLPWQTELYQ